MSFDIPFGEHMLDGLASFVHGVIKLSRHFTTYHDYGDLLHSKDPNVDTLSRALAEVIKERGIHRAVDPWTDAADILIATGSASLPNAVRLATGHVFHSGNLVGDRRTADEG